MRRWFALSARLLLVSAVSACQADPTMPAGVSGHALAATSSTTVASLSLAPDSQMVFVGDQFSLTAKAKNSAGQVLDKPVTWTINNTNIAMALGTTAATMTFKALKAGTTGIKATVDGKTRWSKVVVRSTAGAKVVVTPSTAAVGGGQTVQFVATGLTNAGETANVNVTWTATGGSVSVAGAYTGGGDAGTFRVIATSLFGAADTSAVTVAASGPAVAAVVLVPDQATLTAGDQLQFAAYGRTANGDSVAVTVGYTATGGTITAGGLYAAGKTGGTYRVIAASASGLADTSEVTLVGPSVAKVTLAPETAASRPGQTTRFTATIFNTVGDVVADSPTWTATCGTVSSTGVFVAPGSPNGSCLVVASDADKADTTEVILLADVPGVGIPFGIYDLWTSPTEVRTGTASFTGSHEYIAPADILARISAARNQGIRLILAMTGGSHDRYKTNGVFDEAKWRAAMDTYATRAIEDAIAAGVADGTIIGNSVMDEPQQSGTDSKAWGPVGTMTKLRVDTLCAYVQAIFPTLPVGVGHDASAFEPDSSYRVCQFLIVQYAERKGNVAAWRDNALALGARDGLAIVFSLNLLNGGVQDKTGAWDCVGTGGLGTRSPNCAMTASQVRDWGILLGRAGCAMLGWRYDTDWINRPENQSALSDVAIALAPLARPPCALR